MKKKLLQLLPLTGLFLVACNSSNQTQAPENGQTEEHLKYTSGFSQDNDYDSYTEYEETYEDGNNETSDSDVADFEVQVRATQDPMIRFIFKEEDVTDFAPDKEADDAEYRESGFNGCRKEDGSGLKPNSKIWRIIIDPHFVTCPECL